MSFVAASLIGAGGAIGAAALSDGGGGSGGFSQQPVLTGAQERTLRLLNKALFKGAFRNEQLIGRQGFPGVRPGEVPFGPLQQQGFGLAGGLGQGIGQGIDIFGQALGGFDPSVGQGFLGQAGQALQQGLDFDPTQNILEAFEPSRQLALNTFQQDIVPNLLERFGASSGASGPLNKQLAESGANLALGLSAQTAPFIGQGALNIPGVQFQGAGIGANLAQLPGLLASQGAGLGGQATDLLSQLFNIGALQQGQAAGVAGAEQARFQEAQPFANPFLSLLGPALGTQGFQTAFQQPGPGIGQQLLPALGAFAGGGGFQNFNNPFLPGNQGAINQAGGLGNVAQSAFNFQPSGSPF